MRRRELEEFKKALLEERKRIIMTIKRKQRDLMERDSDHQGTLSSLLINPAEVSDNSHSREMTAELINRINGIVRQIDDALERINDGSFGICILCKSPIPLERLRAIPYTPYCVKCQMKFERSKVIVN